MNLARQALATLPIEEFEELVPDLTLLACQMAETKRKGKHTIPITYTDTTIILHSGLKDWTLDRETFRFLSVDDPEGIRNGRIQ